MTAELPSPPDLELLRKRAKELLRDARRGDPEAVARCRAVPRLASLVADSAVAKAVRLADAQSAIAREHGFPSWPKLKRHVEGAEPLAARAERFLVALAAGGARRAGRLLARFPAIARANLHSAAAAGDAEFVAAVLAREPRLVSAVHAGSGLTPLLFAAASPLPPDAGGLVAGAATLLDAGADPNEAKPFEEDGVRTRLTALYHACVRGHARLARLLLERGANPNDGESVYHAAELDRRECLEVLLSHGADFSSPCAEFGNTPLYFLAGYRDAHPSAASATAGMRYLLERGADPNVESLAVRETPLHRLAANGRSAAVAEMFLDFGADPNRPRADGRTPYALAVRSGNVAFAEALVRRGAARESVAPVDALVGACLRADAPAARAIAAAYPEVIASLGPEDRAMVVHAVFEGCVESVRLMAELGFGLVQEGEWGGTPLHHAAWLGKVAMTRALLDLGAPVDARDNRFGSSPLGWAAHGSTNARPGADDDYVAVVRALLDAGAGRAASINRRGEPPESMASSPLVAVLRERGFLP